METIGNKHLSINNAERRIHIECDGREMDLTMSAYKIILNLEDEINSILSDIEEGKKVCLHTHIGYNYHITISSPFKMVHVRKWGLNNVQKLSPLFTILCFTCKEWNAMLEWFKQIQSTYTYLLSAVPCYDNHQNQMSFFECVECSPNYYYDDLF